MGRYESFLISEGALDDLKNVAGDVGKVVKGAQSGFKKAAGGINKAAQGISKAVKNRANKDIMEIVNDLYVELSTSDPMDADHKSKLDELNKIYNKYKSKKEEKELVSSINEVVEKILEHDIGFFIKEYNKANKEGEKTKLKSKVQEYVHQIDQKTREGRDLYINVQKWIRDDKYTFNLNTGKEQKELDIKRQREMEFKNKEQKDREAKELQGKLNKIEIKIKTSDPTDNDHYEAMNDAWSILKDNEDNDEIKKWFFGLYEHDIDELIDQYDKAKDQADKDSHKKNIETLLKFVTDANKDGPEAKNLIIKVNKWLKDSNERATGQDKVDEILKTPLNKLTNDEVKTALNELYKRLKGVEKQMDAKHGYAGFSLSTKLDELKQQIQEYNDESSRRSSRK